MVRIKMKKYNFFFKDCTFLENLKNLRKRQMLR